MNPAGGATLELRPLGTEDTVGHGTKPAIAKDKIGAWLMVACSTFDILDHCTEHEGDGLQCSTWAVPREAYRRRHAAQKPVFGRNCQIRGP